MKETKQFRGSLGYPDGGFYELPASPKRFPDGAQYRIEFGNPGCAEII
jgi:hypothetical protein